MTTLIRTRQYEASHGKAPKGSGWWAFERAYAVFPEVWFAPGLRTLSEARKWLRQELAAQGRTGEVWEVAP